MTDSAAGLFSALLSRAQISHTAGGVVIESAAGRYVVWVVAFLLVVPLTGYLWRRRIGGPFVKGAFFAAFTIPFVVLPGMATESIRVGPDALEVGTGFWFHPTVRRIELQSVTQVIRRVRRSSQRGFSRRDSYWEFRHRDASGERLQLSDLFEANQEPVVTALRLRGIAVE